MEWSDEGLVLAVRPHGDTGVIAELLTRNNGRHSGFVHGGRSRRLRPVLLTGNHVDVSWRGRLSEQLGHFSLEMRRSYAGEVIDNPGTLAVLSSITTLARLVAERDPHPNLFEITLFVLSFIDDETVWPALYARWELALLDELGVGLDLTQCAATGTNDDLIWVSPKSGRAVSAAAGEPYRDRLLTLPAFLRGGTAAGAMVPSPDDVRAALRLTGHFLEQRVLGPQGHSLPEARSRLMALVERSR
jgi:DNA repair protein RecO (recombination protein O)